jgi:hypothetical protein
MASSAPLLLLVVQLVVALRLSATTSAALEFSAPQTLGGGGIPCYFNGFDTDGGRFVGGYIDPAAGDLTIGALNGTSPWAPQPGANASALSAMYPFPSECRGCRSMETLGELEGLPGPTGTAMNSSGGYRLSVEGGKLVAKLSGVVRRFQGLPRPLKRDSSFSVGGMRWSGTASVQRPNGTLLQTGIVTFADQPMRTDGTRRGPNATSVVLFRSDDGLVWDYVSTIADAKDYPQSWEGPNEM